MITRLKNIQLSPGYWFGLLLLFALSWAMGQSLWNARKQLADLQAAAGQVQSVVVRRTTGKNNYYYVEFKLRNCAELFGIRTASLAVPADEALRDIRRAGVVRVWYERPLFHGSPNFEVYQLETTQHVLFPIMAARRSSLGSFALALLAAALLFLLMLRFYPRG